MNRIICYYTLFLKETLRSLCLLSGLCVQSLRAFLSSVRLPPVVLSERNDRVIHNRGKVALDTEEKIKQILKELDYKTNVFARSLKLQKIFKFGILIAENRTLQGIFVTNVCTHKIADQIKDMSLQGKVQLIGYDLIEKNIHYLKERIINFLISQSPEMQGYQGIYALYRRVVLNERVKARIMMPLDIMTKENIDYYQSFDED